MKCNYCGGNLSLEDEKCPHCGRINQEARQHIQDMKRYSGEFEETKQDVYKTTKRYSQISSRVILLAILIALIFVCFLWDHFYYQISMAIRRTISNIKLESYSSVMDDYIENEEYLKLTRFVEQKDIAVYEENYRQYEDILAAARSYRNLYLGLIALPQTEEEYLPQEAQYLSDELERFYRYLSPETYAWEEPHNNVEQEEAALADMKEKVRLLLMTYCGLTDEEIEGMEAMTSSRRAVLIEEGVRRSE